MAPLAPAGSPASDFTSMTSRSGVVEPAPPLPIWMLSVVPAPATCNERLPAALLQIEAAPAVMVRAPPEVNEEAPGEFKVTAPPAELRPTNEAAPPAVTDHWASVMATLLAPLPPIVNVPTSEIKAPPPVSCRLPLPNTRNCSAAAAP